MRLHSRHLKAKLLQEVSSFQSSGEKVRTWLWDLHKDGPFQCPIQGRADALQAASFLSLHGEGMILKHCQEGPAKKPPLGFIQPLGLTKLQPTWVCKWVYNNSMWYLVTQLSFRLDVSKASSQTKSDGLVDFFFINIKKSSVVTCYSCIFFNQSQKTKNFLKPVQIWFPS